MTRVLEAELQELRQQLLAMGGLAETMIQGSVRSLVERNADLAHMVFRYEEEIKRGATVHQELTPAVEDHSPGSRDLFESDAVVLGKVGVTLPLDNLEQEEATSE